MSGTFPRKRLVNFCTKGFCGYAGYVATSAIRNRADALSRHDRMLGQWKGPYSNASAGPRSNQESRSATVWSGLAFRWKAGMTPSP
jgi:hypothetical protein